MGGRASVHSPLTAPYWATATTAAMERSPSVVRGYRSAAGLSPCCRCWREWLQTDPCRYWQMPKACPQHDRTVALPNSEFANGNTFDLNDRMVLCEHGGRRVIRRLDAADPTSIRVIAHRYSGMRLNSPNNIALRLTGT